MSVDNMYTIDVLVLGCSYSTPSRYSNGAESDTIFKESCNPPIDITKPDSTSISTITTKYK